MTTEVVTPAEPTPGEHRFEIAVPGGLRSVEVADGVLAVLAEMAEKATEFAGALGAPLDDAPVPAAGDGLVQNFADGAVCRRPGTGVHVVYGGIGEHWKAVGGVGGPGFPVTDELPAPGGRVSHFENASIYWSSTTGAFMIYGGIRELWDRLGGAGGGLGFPTSDEQDVPDAPGARRNFFQRGIITWTPWAGARVTALFGVPADGSAGGLHISTVGGGDVPLPQVSRHVIISAAMDITDDETFGSDEHNHVEGRDERWVDSWDPQGVMQLVGRCGGEVRIELNVTAAMRPDGSARLAGDVKLYEGASDQSDDLDGTRAFAQVVPVDGVTQIPITIRNDDEGGDHAELSLTVSNAAT